MSLETCKLSTSKENMKYKNPANKQIVLICLSSMSIFYSRIVLFNSQPPNIFSRFHAFTAVLNETLQAVIKKVHRVLYFSFHIFLCSDHSLSSEKKQISEITDFRLSFLSQLELMVLSVSKHRRVTRRYVLLVFGVRNVKSSRKKHVQKKKSIN